MTTLNLMIGLAALLGVTTAIFATLWAITRRHLAPKEKELGRLRDDAEKWRGVAEIHARDLEVERAKSEADMKALNEKISTLEDVREKLERTSMRSPQRLCMQTTMHSSSSPRKHLSLTRRT